MPLSRSPAIAATGDHVHIVWQDMTISNAEIVYTRSTDGGSTFDNTVKNLSSSSLDSIQLQSMQLQS